MLLEEIGEVRSFPYGPMMQHGVDVDHRPVGNPKRKV
jgi:hypothetical protein